MILQTTADSRSACRESGKKNEATNPSHPQSLKDFRDLRDLKDLKDLKELRELRGLRELREGANAELGPEEREINNGGRRGEKLRGGEGEAEKIPGLGEISRGGAETAILFREIYC